MSVTSLTLLGRLRKDPEDPGSWDEFVARYGPKIYGWCRRWGLQEADAHDVTQNVLLALSKQMKTFEYKRGGRFRSWLHTVAYRAWCDFLKGANRRAVPLGDASVFESFSSKEAESQFLQTIEDECNRELLELALKRVRPRVQESTWEAFQLMTYEQLSAGEVAERLGITKGAAFVARGRVQNMIVQELKRFEEDES